MQFPHTFYNIIIISLINRLQSSNLIIVDITTDCTDKTGVGCYQHSFAIVCYLEGHQLHLSSNTILELSQQ